MNRHGAREIFADAALIAVAVVAFVIIVVGIGATNVELQTFDYRALFSYQLEFYRESVLAGRLPLWNPHTFSGWPFFANPQSRVFYPSSLLYVWLSQPSALSLELTLHLFLAAGGTYAMARHTLGTSRGAALLAAIVFALSGAIFSRVLFGHRLLILAVAYVPLLAFVIDRAVTRAGPWPWIGGLVLGLQILTGGLPVVWLGMVFIGVWRFTSILAHTPLERRAWLRDARALAGITLIGIALAAVQLLPAYELSQLANRPDHDLAYASYGSYDPQFLGTFFRRLDVASNPAWWWGHYSYLGIVPMVLAVIGIISGWRERQVLALAIVGVLMGLYMLGTNGFLMFYLFEFVPTFDLFRHPSRALFFVHLAVALLAAVGADKIWQRLPAASRKRSTLAVCVTVLICLFSWIDIVTASRWYRDTAFVPDAWQQDHPGQIQHAEILARDDTWYRYWFNRGLFRQNHAFAAGARSIDGYDVMILDRYERFIRFMTDTPHDARQLTHITPTIFANTPSPFPFKILGVKYVDVPGRILMRSGAVPRAWVVSAIRLVADEDAALRYMRSDSFAPHNEIVVEDAVARRFGISAYENGKTLTPQATDIRVDELTPERLEIQLGRHGPGYLVLSEIHYPGWQAEIDADETPVIRCNVILRCLRLTGSDTPVRITVAFRPTTLRWGAIISSFTLLFIVSGIWFSRRT